MQFLRKAALTVTASLLTITLFSFGPVWSTYQLVRTPNHIKSALEGSGIYSAAIPAILDQQQKDQKNQPSDQQGEGGTNDIPLDQPEVRQIVEKAFPASFLQTQTEQVLDSTYDWINGNTPQLTFNINISDAKSSLVDGLAQYVLNRLNSLPACTGAEAITTDNIDPFNAACVPAGANKEEIANKIRDQFNNGEFLKDTTINASSVKGKDGKSLADALKNVPDAYKLLNLVIAATAFVAILFGLAVVFLSATRRGGVRKASVILLTVGIVGGLLAGLSNFAVHKFVHKALAEGNTNVVLRPQIISLVQSLADELCNKWIIYSVVLVLLAVAGLLALHFTAPKNAIDLSGQPQKRPKRDAVDLEGHDGTVQRHEHVVAPPHHDKPEEQPKPHD